MHNKNVFLLLVVIFCIGCKKKDPTHPITVVNIPDVPNDQHISVLTQHNDNTRAGWNSQEKKLTTSNVNASQFGKLFTLATDDQVYAQPLVVGNVPIGTGNHNVVFIATLYNSVFAYDSDSGKPYWHKNYTA